jgi:L-alanine-DL-glutamate epimerase-like enolase superfamily enzyme
MRVGVIDSDPRHSARRVAAARAALGPDCGLMCDAHGTFSVAEAKRFCRLVEDCNLAWFEEPVTADDKAGCAQVRAATDIPIAAGESEFTRHDFRDLAMLAAVDIFQPDLAICGGITEAMRISALASAHNLKLRPTSGPAPRPLLPGSTSPPRRRQDSSSSTRSAPTRCCMISSRSRSRSRTGRSKSPTGPASA